MAIDWSTVRREDIIAKYKELTDGDVTEETAALPSGWYKGIEAYANRLKAEGKPWNREAYINALVLQGITPEAAGTMYDRAANFYAVNQRWPGEADVNQWLEELQPGLRQTPTLAREEQEFEQKTRFPWQQKTREQEFQEQRRQFDVGQQGQAERFAANLLAGLTGPQNLVQYEMAKAAGMGGKVPANLQEAFGGAPAWGNVAGGPSWEQQFQRFLSGGGQQLGATGQPITGPTGGADQSTNLNQTGTEIGAAPTAEQYRNMLAQQQSRPGQSTNLNFLAQLAQRQPTQFTAQEYNKMTPQQRAIQGSAWSAAGKVPEDLWGMVRATLPQGTASKRTTWR